MSGVSCAWQLAAQKMAIAMISHRALVQEIDFDI
jgi:hypothetical protein